MKKYIFWAFLVFVFLFRYATNVPHFQNGQVVKISGQVYSEPTTSFGNLKFNLSGIKVSTSRNEDIHYGDEIVIEGVFDSGVVMKAKVIAIKTPSNIFLIVRNKLINFYEDSLGSLRGNLLSGMIIGAKAGIPAYFNIKIQNSGLSYIVEASGIKISILASFLTAIFLIKISRKKTVVLVILFIWFYIFIAGFQAVVIKAGILATIALISQIFGRVNNSLRNTFLAGFIMLFIFPFWLTDIGFVMSFSATISIILFQAEINNFLHFIPEIIRQDLAVSLAAQIGITPLVFFFFGQINFVTPVIKSVLVLWILTPVIIVGMFAGLLSFISPFLARIILLSINPLLVYLVSIISL